MDTDILYIVLDNGVKLYSNSNTSMIEKYALSKGLIDIECYLAIAPNNSKDYVLYRNRNPVFASKKAEDVAVHIDILNLNRRF